MVALQMGKLGRHGMLFLAAAVSDFHVPRDKLREHKIDSSRDAKGGDDSGGGGAGLTLHLDEVCTLGERDGSGVMREGRGGSGEARKSEYISQTNLALPCSFWPLFLSFVCSPMACGTHRLIVGCWGLLCRCPSAWA